MSCYKVLILGDPSFITCEMIAAVIAREAAGLGPRSNQLVSFVVSDLRTSIYYDNIDRVRYVTDPYSRNVMGIPELLHRCVIATAWRPLDYIKNELDFIVQLVGHWIRELKVQFLL